LRPDQSRARKQAGARIALWLVPSPALFWSPDRQIERSGIPLLIDVWAPWCGPCRSMAPMLERAALELEPRVRLLKLNADQAPQLAARLGVRGIPALLLMHSRRILARTSGAMNTARIVEWTNSNLCAAGIDCR
jgi:thioredoxin 2